MLPTLNVVHWPLPVSRVMYPSNQTLNLVWFYVCVCLHSSNFILTSVVLTGLSWGAVLTDRRKEKQKTSEVSKRHQRQSATQPSSRCAQCCYWRWKSAGFVHFPLINPIDTESIGEISQLQIRKRSFTLPPPSCLSQIHNINGILCSRLGKWLLQRTEFSHLNPLTPVKLYRWHL